jgi:spermidine synthase
MEAEEATAKRARAEDGEAASAEVVANGISAVIPGWFSEISPMWPGMFFVAIC